MSEVIEKILEVDRLAINAFEERKKWDKEKDKEMSKHFNNLALKYDKEARDMMEKNGVTPAKLYSYSVNTENTRASRAARYYNYQKWDSPDLDEKERWALDIIKESLKRSEKPVVSSSFGIDSMVTLYLTRKALVELGRDPSDIEVVWSDTLNEFPEVRMFSKRMKEEWNLNLKIYQPKKPLKKIIKENGGVDSSYFFNRKGDRRTNERSLTEKCCGTLKHEPMRRAIKENDWDLQINGVRADESTQRKIAGLRDGEYFYSKAEWKAYSCRPLLWWKDDDIWNYVERENIPHVDLYEKNLILSYPDDLNKQVKIHNEELKKLDVDTDKLLKQEIVEIGNRRVVNLFKKMGFKIFAPRVGCMACPIPVKYNYMAWMRKYYPKVFNTMIYNLEYGKTLLTMIPDEAKEEIEFVMGIDLNEENAHEFLKEVLEAKPCVFDNFN